MYASNCVNIIWKNEKSLIFSQRLIVFDSRGHPVPNWHNKYEIAVLNINFGFNNAMTSIFVQLL